MSPAPGPGPPRRASTGHIATTTAAAGGPGALQSDPALARPAAATDTGTALQPKPSTASGTRVLHSNHGHKGPKAPQDRAVTPSQLVHLTMQRSKKRMATAGAPVAATTGSSEGAGVTTRASVTGISSDNDGFLSGGHGLYRSGASGAESYRSLPFASDEMRQILSLDRFDAADKLRYEAPRQYIQGASLPEWILNSQEWRNARFENKDQNVISEILRVPPNARTPEQRGSLAKWLMDVWTIANDMGFKRCVDMSDVMVYQVVDAGTYVVTEGDQGQTFFIIVSGTASVCKQVAGVVAQMGKGKCFGELALTQGAEVRQASVVAETRMELLSLHKLDYDHFVRDHQLAERRENFATLRNCKLFEHWTRQKIDQMCTNAVRKVYEAGEYVFRQGDVPDKMYIVLEGTLNTVRDEAIVSTNRWPVGKDAWQTVSKRSIEQHFVREIGRGDYFGELAIIKNCRRSAHVVAKTRCILLLIDKLEFLHLLRHKNVIQSVLDTAEGYGDVDDEEEDGAGNAAEEEQAGTTGGGMAGSTGRKKASDSLYRARLKELHAKAQEEEQNATKKVVESSTYADPSRAQRPPSSGGAVGLGGGAGGASGGARPGSQLGSRPTALSPDHARANSPNRPKLVQKSLTFLAPPSPSSALTQQAETAFSPLASRGTGAAAALTPASPQHFSGLGWSQAPSFGPLLEEEGGDRALQPQIKIMTPSSSSRAHSPLRISTSKPGSRARADPHSLSPRSPAAFQDKRQDDFTRTTSSASGTVGGGSGGIVSSGRTRFYEPEDLMLEPASGELVLRPLRRVPVEFEKRISERAKPTFYEVISLSSRPSTAQLSPGGGNLTSPALDQASYSMDGPASPQPFTQASPYVYPQLAGVFSPVSTARREGSSAGGRASSSKGGSRGGPGSGRAGLASPSSLSLSLGASTNTAPSFVGGAGGLRSVRSDGNVLSLHRGAASAIAASHNASSPSLHQHFN